MQLVSLPMAVRCCPALTTRRCALVYHSRYYHCANCVEQTGLFDLCTTCCAGIYLKSGMSPRVQMPMHPTHDYATHEMVHVAPH